MKLHYSKISTIRRAVFFLFTFFLFSGFAMAQSLTVRGSASLETYLSNPGRQPFYFWTNKLGQVASAERHNSFIHFGAEARYRLPDENHSFFAGINTNLRQTANTTYNLPELYGGFETKLFRFTGGLFADSVRMAGLSPSNGNFDITRNAPPHPRLRIGTNNFIRIGSSNFSVAGLFEEGILEKNRAVPKARLHHKNLFLRVGSPRTVQVAAGLDHLVFWGGDIDRDVHEENLKNYLKAVFSGSYYIERLGIPNALGNQLGQYQISFAKSFEKITGTFQVTHIFEDGSGTYLANYPDNMYTLLLNFKRRKLVQNVLLEYVHTKHQSGPSSDPKTGRHLPRGADNYFSHSQYKSGYTYKGFIIGTPLFGPLRYTANEISAGPENNRFEAFHFGISGNLSQPVEYKIMATYSQNYGRYSPKYEKVRNQFYSLAAFTYTFPKKQHLFTGMQFAFDHGSLWTGNLSRDAGIAINFGVRF